MRRARKCKYHGVVQLSVAAGLLSAAAILGLRPSEARGTVEARAMHETRGMHESRVTQEASDPDEVRARHQVELASPAPAAVSVTDDRGRSLSLAAPARRVISLSPALTELVFAAGGAASLVGVIEHSDYPEPARKITRVGDALTLEVERILALQPDLILAWQSGNDPRQLQRLEEFGVPIYYSRIDRLEGVAATLERLGVLLDEPTASAAAAAAFRLRLARLGESGTPPVRVFYQLWSNPLMTVNGRHVISDLIRRCGGVNVFADGSALVTQVGIEAVIAAAPQAIIAPSNRNTSGSNSSDRAAGIGPVLDSWRRYGVIPAVAKDALFTVDGDAISRASPRLLDAGEAICAFLAKVRGGG